MEYKNIVSSTRIELFQNHGAELGVEINSYTKECIVIQRKALRGNGV